MVADAKASATLFTSSRVCAAVVLNRRHRKGVQLFGTPFVFHSEITLALTMTQHLMRLVKFAKVFQFIRAQFHLKRLHEIVQLLEFAGANDGRRDAWLMQHP